MSPAKTTQYSTFGSVRVETEFGRIKLQNAMNTADAKNNKPMNLAHMLT